MNDQDFYQRVKEELTEMNEEMLFADGLEPALIGAVRIFNRTVALYDYEKCIEHLMERDGSSYDSAVEHLEINTLGSYAGENTPGYFIRPESLSDSTPMHPGPRDEVELSNLHGKSLLDALTEAKNNGHYKGWSFSDISRSGTVLPMTVFDHKSEDERITKHEAVVMASMNKGSIASLTVATTTDNGVAYQEFSPVSNSKDDAKALLRSLTPEERMEAFSLFCTYCGEIDPHSQCTCMRDE